MTMQDIKSGDLIVTVYIYDMGSALNAYGIYTTERGADDERLPIGTESILLPPYQVLQLKNQYYIKIDAFEGEIDTVSGYSLLRALEKGLPGSSDSPGELASLPKENKIADSERYIKQSFLGLSELDECIYARYEAEDKPFRIFYVVRDAENIWQKLTEKWTSGSSGNMVLLYREIPYQGPIGIIKTEKGLFGVTDVDDVSQMNERLGHLKKILE